MACYCGTVVETRNPKSGCPQEWFFGDGRWEGRICRSCCPRLGDGSPSLPFHIPFPLCVCVDITPLHKDVVILGQAPPWWPHCGCFPYVKTLSVPKAVLWGLGGLGLQLIFFFFFCLFRAASVAYGGSQARDLIGAVAAGLCHSHTNARCEPCLQPTPQLMASPDP